MTDFIQQYLDAGLFNIADNEERLVKLQASADKLRDQFLADATYIIQFLRASLVPNIDGESEPLAKIESLIKEDWATLRSAQPNRPTNIILAVGWQALRLAVEKEPELCALIWYGSANLLMLNPSINEFVLKFIRGEGDTMQLKAIARWTTQIPIVKEIKPLQYVDFKHTLPQSLLKATTAIDASTSKPIEGGNTNAQSNDGIWASFFAKIASDAIYQMIKQAAKHILDVTQTAITSLAQKDEQIAQSFNAQNRRTELLWLSESLYSLRASKSYRELAPTDLLFALSADISEIATGPSPVSVEYFLSEMATRLLAKKQIKLEGFVNELSKSQICASYSKTIFQPIGVNLRLGLLEFTGALASNQLNVEQFSSRTGFESSKSMSPGELARWLYREMKSTELMKQWSK